MIVGRHMGSTDQRNIVDDNNMVVARSNNTKET